MLSTINNYYEHMVSERIRVLLGESSEPMDSDYLDDIACVALNQLPPRYVRHNVDLAFHMTDSEWEELNRRVDDAVLYAIEFTKRRSNQRPIGDFASAADEDDVL